MSVFEIILISFIIWFALVFAAFFAFLILKTKINNKVLLVKSHREIWCYFAEHEEELKELFNPNAKERALTGMERHFATMLTAHAELSYSMLKTDTVYIESKKPYMADIANVYNKPLMRKYWEETKACRQPSFVKKVEEYLK